MFALVGWPGAVRGALARPGVRAQALLVLVLVFLAVIIWQTASANLSRLSVKSGYGFLFEPAPFELGESMIPFRAGESTYLLAFVVGLLNTIKVAVLGILLSTLLGLVIALGQLSPSIMLARLCRGYIEVARNVPLLLQLIFWHTLLTRSLPSVRNALSPIEGVYLTNRGLYLPTPVADPAYFWVGIATLAGLGLASGLMVRARRQRIRSGQARPVGRLAIAIAVLLPVAVFLACGAPLEIERPVLQAFNFQGGTSLSPEFVAMLLGLTLYHAAFNAEIIRAGILGVSHGQSEAGLSLGLSRWQVMRMVVLPQALRIVIPPMSNSYLSLTKESSLAVAIGYPEIVRVANIAMAATNQAIECISIIMLVYLVLSLSTATLLNWVNARAKLVER
jgi:general L-amino acid transport system permease protein